jgi:hypothetical protein
MGVTDILSKASWGVYTDFQEAFKKLFVEQLLCTLQQEGLGKSMKIPKYFARGK